MTAPLIKPVTRLLDVPETPPRTWFNSDSPDFVMGQTLRVVTTGPDEGRAFGLIQPPPDLSRYMPGRKQRNGARHRNHGRPPPDARMFPDNFAVFNRGAVEVMEDDGATVGTIAAGKLPVLGKHSADAVGAETLDQAVEWLHREGRWTAQADDLGLVGVASAVDDPRYAGAVMFRGAALPGMTLREAKQLNGVSVSAEVWDDPYWNDELVFAGALVCDHTAWPYQHVPDSLAAETSDSEVEVGVVCDGPRCYIVRPQAPAENVDSSRDVQQAGPVAASTDEGTQVIDLDGGGQLLIPPGSTNAEWSDRVKQWANRALKNPACGCGNECACALPASMNTARPDHVAADVTDEDLDSVRTGLEEINARIDNMAVDVAELSITVYAGENLGAENELAGMGERIRHLEELVEQLKANNQNVTAEQPDNNTTELRPSAVLDVGPNNRTTVGYPRG